MENKSDIVTELAKVYDENPSSKYLEVGQKQYAEYARSIRYIPEFGIWFRGKQLVIKQPR